jgi:long-subunit acyl-CoA synthetase (AMP-forming)
MPETPALVTLTAALTYDDTWAILYTSGTTGRPKGAQVTYGNFFYNAVGMGQAIDLHSPMNINVLPTFHAGGLGLYAGPTCTPAARCADARPSSRLSAAADPGVAGVPSCCWCRPST